MIYYSGTRYTTLSRPLSFDRRALIALTCAGTLPQDIDRQLSAVHRRQALRAAHEHFRANLPGIWRSRRLPPG